MNKVSVENYKNLIEKRRSVRGFLPDVVSQEILDSVFTLAQLAPSNCNTQPWTVHVAAGSKCEQLKAALSDAMLSGDIVMDYPYEGKYEGIYKNRQHDAANQLYTAMGINREDKEKRSKAFFDNFNFFGAPHAAFLFLPEKFGIREAADLGMYAQSLMLSLTAHGLASCPQTALSFQANKVREILGIQDNLKLLFGISFGYEDRNALANKTRIGRVALNEAVHFHC